MSTRQSQPYRKTSSRPPSQVLDAMRVGGAHGQSPAKQLIVAANRRNRPTPKRGRVVIPLALSKRGRMMPPR